MPFTISDFFSSGIIGKYFFETPWIILGAAIIIISAYLLGSINFAIIISGKKYKEDIRSYGSKNAGMTNMMRTYGKTAAALTLTGDAMKAIVACLLGYAILGQLGAYIAGLFCMLGHVFPVFYRFKGGKGVVTAFAAVLMCDPFVFVIIAIIFVLIVLFTRYISLGSIMCMFLYPIILDRVTNILTLFGYGKATTSPYIIFPILMAALVVIKHWENIKRLVSGTENKFSFKKSVKTPESNSEDVTK